jgi:tetratricopeptide (TPR) repeat protein
MTADTAAQAGAKLERESAMVRPGSGGGEPRGKSCQNDLPGDVPALFSQALGRFQAGQLSEAERILGRILELQPEHLDSLHLLGIVSSQQGKHAEGLRFLDMAAQIDARSAALHNSRGNVLAALQRFDEALTSFDTAIALDPRSALAFGNRGNACRELGRLDEALASYDQAIALDPADAEAFYNRGGALQELERPDEAVASYDQAIALRPGYAEALSNRGTALQALQRYAEAVASYDKAIALRPDLPEALCSRGSAFQKMERYDEAITSYDRAIALKPDFAQAFDYRGMCLQGLGRFEEAVASYNKAGAIAPDYAEAFRNRGVVLRMLGRLDEALGAFEQAIALTPRDAVSHFNLVSSRRVDAADPHFAVMKELALNAGSLDTETQIKLHFGLSKAFADVGDMEQSFHHMLVGNSLKRQQVTYREADTLAGFARIQSAFTAELMRDKRGLGDPTPVPVFIVGMPRSGTTLVEQILASHSKVFGAGELTDMERLAGLIRGPNESEFPEAVAAMSGDRLRAFGGKYLRAIRALAPTAERITDKLPPNFRYLGLIRLALPNARIIHTCRDLRDTALSCFSILFAPSQLEFTYDLVELGRYCAGYQRLMEHWRKVLPAGAMLEVQYEELVDDLEGHARRIVGHCGLEWDEACLEFHRTKRVVRTASATQVRQPIYRSSVGRWRQYGDRLQPFLQSLAEAYRLGLPCPPDDGP